MIATILTLVVAAIHLYFTLLEMVRWEHPRTRAIFGTTAEMAAETKVMAANQGLYNAFLAVGLIFGAATGNTPMVAFLLACVIVAGAYAATTMGKRVLLVQSLPAVLALGALALGI
ncbi:DUF1304 domain-containing protein [Yoonia sp. R2331]|uniref:DUF1304 domain-containing protein n=1 Tax=Yoonia sp. R2331 TaxID=3237238 RepID=UPI0034E5130D